MQKVEFALREVTVATRIDLPTASVRRHRTQCLNDILHFAARQRNWRRNCLPEVSHVDDESVGAWHSCCGGSELAQTRTDAWRNLRFGHMRGSWRDVVAAFVVRIGRAGSAGQIEGITTVIRSNPGRAIPIPIIIRIRI